MFTDAKVSKDSDMTKDFYKKIYPEHKPNRPDAKNRFSIGEPKKCTHCFSP
jgi:hypothetical protein